MVNVFSGSIASGPGNLQVAKKVIVAVGKDYSDEIQQSYVLGFTPYSLHKNVDDTFVTPIRVYDGKVYIYWTILPRWMLAIDILQRMQ